MSHSQKAHYILQLFSCSVGSQRLWKGEGKEHIDHSELHRIKKFKSSAKKTCFVCLFVIYFTIIVLYILTRINTMYMCMCM